MHEKRQRILAGEATIVYCSCWWVSEKKKKPLFRFHNFFIITKSASLWIRPKEASDLHFSLHFLVFKIATAECRSQHVSNWNTRAEHRIHAFAFYSWQAAYMHLFGFKPNTLSRLCTLNLNIVQQQQHPQKLQWIIQRCTLLQMPVAEHYMHRA